MTSAQLVATTPDRLHDLVGRLEAQQGFAEVIASLQAGHAATLGGVWGSSRALVAASLARHAPGPLVVVWPHMDDIDDFCDDVALFTAAVPERFPAWERELSETTLLDETYGERLRLLKRLGDSGPAPVVVTSIQSLLQPVPSRQELAEQTRRVRRGESIDLKGLLAWLVEGGFQNTTAVELPGEFSPRGGIVDVFAPDWFDPVRIELFGDEVESIRRFEVSSQRSLESLDDVDITLAAPGSRQREHFTSYLPPNAWFYLIEPGDVEEEGERFLERLERPQDAHGVGATLREITRFASVTAESVPAGSLETTCHLGIESVERFSGDIAKVRDELDAAMGAGSSEQDVYIVCQNEAESQRLHEVFAPTRLAQAGKLHYTIGRLKSGFRLVADRIALVSGSELFHRADLNRPTRRRLGRAIDSFLELREGDYVVHLSHGIGRYRGLELLEKAHQAEEHLIIEFHGNTKVYVPASKIELVQKYVGGSKKSRPTLAHVGGRLWAKQKEAAKQAVVDLAADMLDLQAARASRPGIRFPAGTAWQREFDASFPYLETQDQLTSITSIKADMAQPRPMDRLLCGDVGFGKTELAMRAAFQVVDAGYQVAVLVPTTILAEQHQRTFRARMSEFPVTIASLSRFCSTRQTREILEGLAEGTIDIVIGTHRLAQHDVSFQNLGLVIIDEEQRFGVEVKERLKALRHTVDVLTMTATPIPRTLHLSLLGVRDISNLETPPEDRLAIETRVTRFEPQLVRHAIMRELNRDGQIFFVHNRVQDIEKVAHKLEEIVPEARIAIGHGQMAEGELEQVMLDFVDHKFDLLLATTIVESGLDIPNANTIFIDEADRYGLADLHQLRGRVGRYKHRAYCYLLVDPHKHLSGNAARRLRAIEEFSQMGSGFAIAMRDLELRGAGNILGTQQSGHIATVGYELYCELLEEAVRKLKALPPKDTVDVAVDLPCEAYIPRAYVPDMRLKIDLYRRVARLSTIAEWEDLRTELVDRFGPRPAEVDRLLHLAKLRIWAHRWGISAIHVEDSYVVLAYQDRRRIDELREKSGGVLRIVDSKSAYLPLGKKPPASDRIVDAVQSLLQPE
ncbi:MAG: transcription-repair coupling factor [Planctomycetota bacterium]|nr:MAG: transcription-repair coupling factor [Planctomycetota bacterium]